MCITQEYLNHYHHYSKLYGDNTIILMMVGSFYEMYSVNNDGPNVKEISKLLNIQNTHKLKAEKETMTNPLMAGFQMNSLDKFVEILVNNDYAVIIFDQKALVNSLQKKFTRELTHVYTKCTYIKNITSNENNYLVCIFLN